MKYPQSRLLPALLLLAAALLSRPALAQEQTHVCMETSVGNICIELFADTAPQTVENFLTYVNGGDYDGTFFHRLVPGFVMQGGGYYFSDATDTAEEVPADDPVVNEFNRSNTWGTIAMAKLGGDPDSATNQWFFNLADNASSLDGQNGGFTVFGRVIGNGMTIVHTITRRAAVRNLSSTLGDAFTNVPVLNTDDDLSADDFVTLIRAYATDADNLPPNLYSAAFTGRVLTAPLRYRSKLYQVTFDRMSTPPEYTFRARPTQIVELNDTGQEAGVIADGQMVIPTLVFGLEVYHDLVFELTDAETLDFTLTAYTGP